MLDTTRPDSRHPAPGPLAPATEGASGAPLASLLTLAREIHDTAIQRLCGVALLLSADAALSDEHRALCQEEISSALLELRGAIASSLTRQEPAHRLTSQQELANLRSRHAPAVRFSEGDLPMLPLQIADLLDTALAEAFRNVSKHALPQSVDVRLESSGETLTLSVCNDGAERIERAAAEPTGLGLRLLQMDAASVGGIVECHHADDLWTLRMTLPIAS